jgi:UDP-N-acetylmuramyl pentapeptide phosphotransferase/UDP-N-acetylglucosamine-1-phosphate transferase
LPKIEEGGKSWLRRPKLHKRVVEPHKKKKKKKKAVLLVTVIQTICCVFTLITSYGIVKRI